MLAGSAAIIPELPGRGIPERHGLGGITGGDGGVCS